MLILGIWISRGGGVYKSHTFAKGSTMRLESALITSREGLTSHGQAIAVVGDNISNISTVGYKGSRVEFIDLFAEGDASPELPTSGSGAKIGRVRQSHEGGVIEATGRSLDAGIAGQGFFVVGDAASPYYTRAGNFEISGEGFLQTPDGYNLLGYAGNQLETLSALNVNTITLGAEATTSATITGNISSINDNTAVPADPQSFNQIAAAASFVNSVEVFDAQGGRHNISLAFFKTAPGSFEVQAYMDGGELEGGTAGVPEAIGNTLTLAFDGSGAVANPEAAVLNVTPSYIGGVAQGNIAINLGGFTQYAAPSAISSFVRDGQSVGQVDAYEFDQEGGFYAKLDNGERLLIGTVPLATFTNLDGLDRAGSARFATSGREGTRTLFVPSNDSIASLEPGSLERSTVDLAAGFVDLVVYQRGYQANSQSLNVANEMLRDTLSLLR